MSDNENGGAKAGKGWTDRERLVYLVALMEKSAVGKLDFKSTPRPQGRSEIACQRMIDRLKVTLKDDLEKLKAGQEIDAGDAAPKTPKTPSKRKTKAAADEGGSPKKRGRKNKVAEAEDGQGADGGNAGDGIKQELEDGQDYV
ncbi:uncharacterized protein EI97DRAFT_388256 [Westerdykella ornata]|uniref:Uncharacterized protein n=1 Tax=Westerdykella ornata TaxID=318751 RepID=A0A6A6J4S5_WESOR|nr:uncharacterized protein EI97DRAFT_388256 [Westerdykella ornata]KAF2271274.1 hypothetical protein EI97DRAFT_388256 [Westerdykella ornata]